MSLEELHEIHATLMQKRCYMAAWIVRQEIVLRELSRDAILDYAESVAE